MLPPGTARGIAAPRRGAALGGGVVVARSGPAGTRALEGPFRALRSASEPLSATEAPLPTPCVRLAGIEAPPPLWPRHPEIGVPGHAVHDEAGGQQTDVARALLIGPRVGVG